MTTKQAHIDTIDGETSVWEYDPATSTYTRPLARGIDVTNSAGAAGDTVVVSSAGSASASATVTGNTAADATLTTNGRTQSSAYRQINTVNGRADASSYALSTQGDAQVLRDATGKTGASLSDSCGSSQGDAHADCDVIANVGAASAVRRAGGGTSALVDMRATSAAGGAGFGSGVQTASTIADATIEFKVGAIVALGDVAPTVITIPKSGALVMLAIDDATVVNPPPGSVALFFDSTNADKLSYKTSAGAVVVIATV